MAKSVTPKLPEVLSLKVTLRGTKPPIWRRLLVPGTMRLGDLHHAIQAAVGWHGGHLHAFEIDGTQYGDRSVDDEMTDENRLTLDGVLKLDISRFDYTYDFGDGWEHTLVIEKAMPAEDGQAYPTCIAGKRNCPPEDCGGPWGFAELLDILADPAHPEHAERREWLGEAFDPASFSIADAATSIAARFGKRKRGA